MRNIYLHYIVEKQKPNATITSGGQIVSLQKGKLPPQAIDLEEAVLGAMMIDKKGVDTVIDILSPRRFISKLTNTSLRPLFICFQTQPD